MGIVQRCIKLLKMLIINMVRNAQVLSKLFSIFDGVDKITALGVILLFNSYSNEIYTLCY